MENTMKSQYNKSLWRRHPLDGQNLGSPTMTRSVMLATVPCGQNAHRQHACNELARMDPGLKDL